MSQEPISVDEKVGTVSEKDTVSKLRNLVEIAKMLMTLQKEELFLQEQKHYAEIKRFEKETIFFVEQYVSGTQFITMPRGELENIIKQLNAEIDTLTLKLKEKRAEIDKLFKQFYDFEKEF